jgi:hypothetical protein
MRHGNRTLQIRVVSSYMTQQPLLSLSVSDPLIRNALKVDGPARVCGNCRGRQESHPVAIRLFEQAVYLPLAIISKEHFWDGQAHILVTLSSSIVRNKYFLIREVGNRVAQGNLGYPKK